jgi:8-oxo-dGTP diphosphatase
MTEYPKISVTVDCVLFNIDDNEAHVLLIQRGPNSKAFPNAWAIPGGFLNQDEKLVTGAARELFEETGIEINGNNLDYPGLIYVGVYDDPKRDPRGRVISHVYTAWVHHRLNPKGSDDAQDAKWFPCQDLPEMAFDHLDIVREAYLKLLHAPDFHEG